jgi:hypothetical protein
VALVERKQLKLSQMTPEERLERIERSLERHIQFVGDSLVALSQQVTRTAAAQEETESHLQRLIEQVDRIAGRVDKLEQK